MGEEKKFEFIGDFLTVFRDLDKVDREKVEDGIFPLVVHMAKKKAHSYALHEDDMENAERKYWHGEAERVYKFFYTLMEECYREDAELAVDETEEEEAELCKGSFIQEIAKIHSAELREARKKLGKGDKNEKI